MSDTVTRDAQHKADGDTSRQVSVNVGDTSRQVSVNVGENKTNMLVITDSSVITGETKTGSLVIAGKSETDSSLIAGETDTGSSVIAGETETGSSVIAGETDTDSSVIAGETDTGSSVIAGGTETGSSVIAGGTETGSSLIAGETETGSSVIADETETGSSVIADETETGSSVIAGETETGSSAMVMGSKILNVVTIEQLISENTQLKDQLNIKSQQLDQLQHDLLASQLSASHRDDEIQTFRNKLETLSSSDRLLRQHLVETQGHCEGHLTQAQSEHVSAVNKLSELMELNQSELKSVVMELERSRNELEEMTGYLEQQQVELEQTKRHLIETQEQLHTSHATELLLKQQVECLQKNLSVCQQSLSMSAGSELLVDRLGELQLIVSEQNEQLHNVNTESDKLRCNFELLTTQHKTLTADNQQLNSEVVELRRQVALLAANNVKQRQEFESVSATQRQQFEEKLRELWQTVVTKQMELSVVKGKLLLTEQLARQHTETEDQLRSQNVSKQSEEAVNQPRVMAEDRDVSQLGVVDRLPVLECVEELERVTESRETRGRESGSRETINKEFNQQQQQQQQQHQHMTELQQLQQQLANEQNNLTLFKEHAKRQFEQQQEKVRWTIEQLRRGFDKSISDREQVHSVKMQNLERQKDKEKAAVVKQLQQQLEQLCMERDLLQVETAEMNQKLELLLTEKNMSECKSLDTAYAQGLEGLGGQEGPGGLDGLGGLEILGGLEGPAGLEGPGGLEGLGGLERPGGLEGPSGLERPEGLDQNGRQEDIQSCDLLSVNERLYMCESVTAAADSDDDSDDDDGVRLPRKSKVGELLELYRCEQRRNVELSCKVCTLNDITDSLLRDSPSTLQQTYIRQLVRARVSHVEHAPGNRCSDRQHCESIPTRQLNSEPGVGVLQVEPGVGVLQVTLTLTLTLDNCCRQKLVDTRRTVLHCPAVTDTCITQTETHAYTHTETQTDTQTQTETETETQTETHTDTHAYTQTETQTDTQTECQMLPNRVNACEMSHVAECDSGKGKVVDNISLLSLVETSGRVVDGKVGEVERLLKLNEEELSIARGMMKELLVEIESLKDRLEALNTNCDLQLADLSDKHGQQLTTKQEEINQLEIRLRERDETLQRRDSDVARLKCLLDSKAQDKLDIVSEYEKQLAAMEQSDIELNRQLVALTLKLNSVTEYTITSEQMLDDYKHREEQLIKDNQCREEQLVKDYKHREDELLQECDALRCEVNKLCASIEHLTGREIEKQLEQKQNLETKHLETLEKLEVEYNAKISQLVEEQQATVESLNVTHNKKIIQLIADHKAAIQDMEQQHNNKVIQLIKDFNVQMVCHEKQLMESVADKSLLSEQTEQRLQREHKQQMSELYKQLTDREQKYERETQELEQKYAAEINKLNIEIDSIQRQLLCHRDATQQHRDLSVDVMLKHRQVDIEYNVNNNCRQGVTGLNAANIAQCDTALSPQAAVPNDDDDDDDAAAAAAAADGLVHCLQRHNALLQAEISQLTDKVTKLKVRDRELKKQVESMKSVSAECNKLDDCSSIEERTELQYLRNILYKYMLGMETKTLAKVICTVVKFSDEETQTILDKEDNKQQQQLWKFGR